MIIFRALITPFVEIRDVFKAFWLVMLVYVVLTPLLELLQSSDWYTGFLGRVSAYVLLNFSVVVSDTEIGQIINLVYLLFLAVFFFAGIVIWHRKMVLGETPSYSRAITNRVLIYMLTVVALGFVSLFVAAIVFFWFVGIGNLSLFITGADYSTLHFVSLGVGNIVLATALWPMILKLPYTAIRELSGTLKLMELLQFENLKQLKFQLFLAILISEIFVLTPFSELGYGYEVYSAQYMAVLLMSGLATLYSGLFFASFLSFVHMEKIQPLLPKQREAA